MGKVDQTQFDIMINPECNARCAFCVQEVTYKPDDEGDELFLQGVRRHTTDYYNLDGRRMIITGGEPTLRPKRLLQVVTHLSQYKWDLMAMYTNSSHLLRPHGTSTIAAALKQAGLMSINCSVHHWDREKNDAIFKIAKPDQRDVSSELRAIELPFRFCCAIQRGGVETIDDVMRYVDYARESGASSVYFRELFSFSSELEKTAGRPEVFEFSKTGRIEVAEIVTSLAGTWKVTKQLGDFHGREKNEIEFDVDGFPVTFATLHIGGEDKRDVPYLLVMPDGQLYATWHGRQGAIASLHELD